MSRNRNRRTVELEFTIPFSDSSEESDEAEMTCYICTNSFCGSGACSRTSTTLKCCTQPICCACVAKTAKRCGCTEDCDQIIAHCPFCRDISPLTAKDVFFGLKATACKTCLRTDAVPAAAVAVGQATVVSSSLPITIVPPYPETHESTQQTQETLPLSV
jgi:hypothetical protein